MNPTAPPPTPARYELSEAGLTQALADLGDTTDRVADALRRGNHYGAICSEAAYSLTGYLAATFPYATHIRVTSTQALLRHAGGTVRSGCPGPSGTSSTGSTWPATSPTAPPAGRRAIPTHRPWATMTLVIPRTR